MIMKQIETFLSFISGTERFAVSVHQVLEVLQKQPVTILPNAPETIIGVINFRGDIVPVYDFRHIFKFAKRGDDKKPAIIIFSIANDIETTNLACATDAVKDVFEINMDEIKPLPQFGYHFNPEYIKGIYMKDNLSYLMLNVNKVFSITELNAINENLQTADHEIVL
jgi:purine-binding chemotaxis protein CheW